MKCHLLKSIGYRKGRWKGPRMTQTEREHKTKRE
jgi:hypothetical protein